jgi:Tfp pilus assembly protein PilF
MEQVAKDSPDRRLDSWKEIAAFFGRDERTVRRWEKEHALPVHRIPGAAKGRVFAYQAELQQWLLTSQAVDSEGPTLAANPPPELLIEPVRRSGFLPFNKWLVMAGVCAVLAAAVFAYRSGFRFPVHASGATRTTRESGGTESSKTTQAEDLYLQGRYYWNKRTPEDLHRAVDYFTQAIVHDPNSSRPYVGLADCYNLLREYSAMPANEAYPRALAAATKAVELDPSSAEAHTSLAFVTYFWSWDAPGAEHEFQQALALNPNDARAHHWYASFLFASGRYAEALDQIEAARRIDPSSVAILADKGLILGHAGQKEAAMTLLGQIEVADPSFASPHRYMAELYFDKPDYPKYLSEWKRTALLTHDQQDLAIVQAAEKGFSERGPKGMLEATLELQRSFYKAGSVAAYSLALTYARLGKKQEALQYLKIACDSRESAVLALPNQPDFDGLHDDPRYKELVARVRPVG